ncbi:MAG: hypothetical protein KA523_01825 [Flavobacterium sp.]|nr:hypothetical protein [Flavobacterium sp.]
MKKIIFILLVITLNSSAQRSPAKYWLDPEGKEIKIKYLSLLSDKYPDNSLAFRKTKDSGYVYQFNAPKYSTYKVDYKSIKFEIEKITNNIYSDSTIFLIKYHYFDDNCSDWTSNKMTKENINNIKKVHGESINQIKKLDNRIEIIYLFENEIELNNNTNIKSEFFYSDYDNFFRKNLFINTTVCGSFGLIKPNGQTLIRNGESHVNEIYDHLKPEIWNLIFQQ